MREWRNSSTCLVIVRSHCRATQNQQSLRSETAWLKCAMQKSHTQEAVNGDKQSKGLIGNTVMLIRGIIRTIKYHIESNTQEALRDDSPILPWLVEHAGCILSRCQEGVDGKTPFERLHGKKPTQVFDPFFEKFWQIRSSYFVVVQFSTDPMNRMKPRYKFGIWLGTRNKKCIMFHCERRRCAQSS